MISLLAFLNERSQQLAGDKIHAHKQTEGRIRSQQQENHLADWNLGAIKKLHQSQHLVLVFVEAER